MKVGVVTRRLVDRPWPQGLWSLRVAQGLFERGHDVTMITSRHALHDASTGEVDVISTELSGERRALDGARLRAWTNSARKALAALAPDVSISFDRLVPASVYAPEQGGTIESLAPLKRPPWISLAHRYLPMGREELDTRSRRLIDVVAACGDEDRAELETLAPHARAQAIGWGSDLTPPAPGDHAAHRRRARDLLGVDDARVAWLLFLSPRAWDEGELIFEALRLRKGRSESDTLLLLGPSPLDARWRAQRFGIEDRVVAMGRSREWDSALLAADIALAPGGPPRARARTMIADALRCGVPVVADRRYPGAELLAPGRERPMGAGLLIERATADDWRRAMDDAASPARLESLRGAALLTGATLGIQDTINRLHELIEELAVSRPSTRRAS